MKRAVNRLHMGRPDSREDRAPLPKRATRLAGAAFVLTLAVTATLVGTAGAALTSGSQITDAVVPISPDPTSGQAVTTGTPFSSGQTVEVSVPANTVLLASQNVEIEECADPGGVLPTQPSECDTNTLSQDTIIPGADGSFTYRSYQVYAVPDPLIGDAATSAVDCNLTDECVLGIFDNVDDFTQPHFFSQGFYTNPTADDSGDNPGDGSAPQAAAAPSASLSTVSASPTTAVADGVSSSTVTVTLNGQNATKATVPIPGAPVTLAADSGTHSTVVTSPATTNSSGVATFTVTDSTAEPVTYTASSGSVTVTQAALVTFAAPAVSAADSKVSASAATVASGGNATVTVTLQDQGSDPQPIGGQSVTLTADSGAQATIATSSTTTNSSGVATFTVSDTASEVVTFTAASGGVTVAQTAKITFGDLAVSPVASTVVAGTPTASTGAGLGSQVTVTLLTGPGGSPVAGKSVVLAATGTNAAVISPSTPVVTGPTGVATFEATDDTAESVTFGATDQTDNDLAIGSATVQFVAPTTVSPTLSSVAFAYAVPGATSTPADGTTPFNVIVTVKNVAGQAVVGDVVLLTPTTSGSNVEVTGDTPAGSNTQGATDTNGEAEFQVRDTTAESVTFTVSDTTASTTITGSPATPFTLTFVAGTVDGVQSTIAASPTAVAADGKTASNITVTLEDHFNNPVAGQTVTLDQGDGHSSISPTSATTGSNGVATFEVTDSTNENVTYAAVVTSDENLTISQSTGVAFGTPPPDVPVPDDSVVVSNYSSVPADGKTAAAVSVLLYDANGLPIPGRTVKLTASGGSSVISPATLTTDKDGAATFTVTDSTPQTVTYTAQDTTDNIAVTGSVSLVFTTASAPSATSTTSKPANAPVVGMATTPDGGGYWLVAADGGVFSYGDARFHGSAGGLHLNRPVVGMAATPEGGGYWLVASDGGVLTYGDAHFYGSAGGLHLNTPIVGMAATPDGGGYWLVAADGGVFSYGDARFHGSAGGLHLNRPVVGMAATPDGGGYWLVAADGGIFRYGDATFDGSTGGLHLNKPVVGMAATPDGGGYWLVASDGGIFTFGDAGFHGSTGSLHLNKPIVGMSITPPGAGYWLVASDGGIFGGNAHFYGSAA